MNEFEATLILTGMFALRCLVPLALTLMLGYLMNRLSNYREAREAGARGGYKPALPTFPRLPALPQLPIHPACWLMNNCDPARREKCPAYQRQDLACWQARLEAEGALPGGCRDCPLYLPVPA